ncbi:MULTISPECIES: outer membrane protein transport protein [Flavobacterium]|uniref:OmpP1/FadL family transporter n=1 Tax=Flavobacterium TaxID=237 RepID=UPI00086F32DA|nr:MULTISPECIES: outer membrane protein transport protein [Flavobacterium]MBN9286240.1 outer membrane protein transport protein [Flavobacterium sp.]ODS85796.1 MAG: transporter [Chryseobacterium sp. SCN 40-13]OJV73858.1 MAG: transporter [Flavobacterium sp. 40-81]
MRKLLSLTLLALASSSAFAGGYRVSLQGQKQLAMGHTGVAVVNSAEVMFFNPAGMSFLKDRFNLSVGANILTAKTKFQNETYNWKASTTNTGTPFNVYASYRITDWLTAGVAVYSPYGSEVAWDKDWEGAHLVNKIDLKSIYVQPTISLKVNEYFSVGGGPIYVNGSVEFNRNLFRGDNITDANGNRPDVTLDAKGISGWGYNVGFMFNPTKKMRLGVNYRSKIVMEARDGDATFNEIPTFLQGTLYNTKFNADLPLPAELTAGLSYQVTDKFLLAFDINRAMWSAYKALVVEFANGAPTSVNPRNYKDATTYRVGAQYKANEKFTFRAGWYHDESPVQDGYFAPETPRNSSMGYTGGLTYQIGKKFGVDVSFLYLHFDEVNNSYDHYTEGADNNVSFGGTYKSSVFSPGLGITYSF